jgi:hypothetical protein
MGSFARWSDQLSSVSFPDERTLENWVVGVEYRWCRSKFTLYFITGFAPDPEGLYHSPEVLREVIRTYVEEKNRIDEVDAEVSEERIELFLEINEFAAIVSNGNL